MCWKSKSEPFKIPISNNNKNLINIDNNTIYNDSNEKINDTIKKISNSDIIYPNINKNGNFKNNNILKISQLIKVLYENKI